MTARNARIDLVPWDYDSSEHVERMYLQRLACGWRSEEVREKWTGLGRQGHKTLYWVVIRDDVSEREKVISQHIAHNPKESTPIHDTAPTHWHQPRTPSGHPIHPIGHISLDLRAEQNAALNLIDEGIVWVAGLFISHTLQAGGFGREVMQRAELIAAQPPLNGKWIVLDTMRREQQMSSGFIQKMYLAHGRAAPTVATQDWYERQGYRVFSVEKAGYKWVNPETGERVDIDYLFLKKRLQE
ncbi:hypothetical protein N0V82_005202 [Gnomoniopsis sp. IMI 355080]|nr:hypothetical protein N0V82_005202 [Gnomoniopsis sp. IMI 355080]